MVRKNEYPRKSNFIKDGAQESEPVHSNSPQKTFQRDGEFQNKENNTRNNRPPRENQQRDSNQQKEYEQRDVQKRENTPRDNQLRENLPRDNTPRDNQLRENVQRDNHQRNFQRDNTQNRENFRDTREPYRQHTQRPVIKPRAEETVEDIAADIGRLEKEIELELKEIKSMRLGV